MAQDRFRVPNDRGGHDLTADGWRELARLQKQLATATEEVADAIDLRGRNSVAFTNAHARWIGLQRQMLSFVGVGELFEVVTVPRQGRN